MMRQEIKGFYEKNRAYTIGVVVLLVLCVSIAWFVYDRNRNAPVYHDTDATVAELKKRIDTVEQRLGTMQDRIEQNQKAVEAAARRISTSTGLAIEITESAGRAEERLESAIRRSERIEGIVADIEAANRQGTADTSQTGVAK